MLVGIDLTIKHWTQGISPADENVLESECSLSATALQVHQKPSIVH